MYQKLGRAYETIKDPEKRRIYDIRWESIRNTQRTQQEAAEAERKRAAQEAQEKADKQKEETTRQDQLRHLELHRSRYDGDIFEANRVVRRLVADLKRLQDQDDEEKRKEKERNSWWTYMTSPIYSKPKETEIEKQERENKRLQRLASRSIKENELTQRNAKLQSLQDALQDVSSKIAAVKKKEEDEARVQAAKRQERLRKEQEAKRLREEEEMCEARTRWAKMQEDRAAQAAKEAREAAQERVRKATDERRKAESEERARAARVAEAARKAQDQPHGTFQPETPSYRASRASRASHASASNETTCRHDKFWTKIEGSHLCSNCHSTQRHFAFQCPGCRKIACASCRRSLRGEKSGKRRTDYGRNNHRSDFGYNDYDYD